jgi:N12 class adenine-specific DNA methylase
MRGLVNNFIKFIPEYVNCIINGYKSSPISSYIYAFEILVTVFPRRKEQELRNILNDTFNKICNITFSNYIKKLSDLDIYVQIGEDFYGMLYRTMKQSPRIIIENEILEGLINISVNYMSTNQIQVAKNIIVFFQYFIKFQNSNFFEEMIKEDNILAENCKKIVQDKINKFGDILCQKILQIFINTSIGQIIEDLTELFIIFISCQKTLVIRGMNIYLKDCPNDILTNKEKKQFINLIENYSVKEEEFKSFLNNFLNRCENKQIRNRGEN